MTDQQKQTIDDIARLRQMAWRTADDTNTFNESFPAADAMEELSKLQSAGGDVTQEDIDSLLTEAATYDINAMEPGITEKGKAFCVAEAAKLRRIVNAVVERGKLKAENLEWLAAVRESYHAGTWEAHAKAQQKLSDLRLGNADVNTPETEQPILRA